MKIRVKNFCDLRDVRHLSSQSYTGLVVKRKRSFSSARRARDKIAKLFPFPDFARFFFFSFFLSFLPSFLPHSEPLHPFIYFLFFIFLRGFFLTRMSFFSQYRVVVGKWGQSQVRKKLRKCSFIVPDTFRNLCFVQSSFFFISLLKTFVSVKLSKKVQLMSSFFTVEITIFSLRV